LIITGANFGTNKNDYESYLDNEATPFVPLYTLNIYNISDSMINCSLGGGKVGSYRFRLLKINFGSVKIEPSNNGIFQYKFDLASITPSIGSMMGGTELTLTGVNISPKNSQNQVYIGVENILCDVKEASNT
jgi:hypothetical protein